MPRLLPNVRRKFPLSRKLIATAGAAAAAATADPVQKPTPIPRNSPAARFSRGSLSLLYMT